MSNSAPYIPFRHGSDTKRGRLIARPISWLIRHDPEPSAERWQALGEGLMQGDPPMDRLLDWMQARGIRTARAWFDRALEQGIDAVPDAPLPLRDFFEGIERRPRWLDDDLLRQGAEASQLTGLTGMRALRDVALMGGYRASAINKTLVLTGALANGPQRRLAETTKWWVDCTQSNGMDRYADGFKSTIRVRLIHALIRRNVQQLDAWRVREWGLPVNQTDMAATQLGFSVIFLFATRLLGVPMSRREGHAVMHLWRYIGWLMGVDERWLPEDEQTGRVLLYQILLSQAPADQSSRQLGRALMEEPMQRFYPNLAALRSRYERARHLSINRLFLGSAGMRDLGLPQYVLPWYPLISAPLIGVRHGVHRMAPLGRARLIRVGRDAQVNYLKILFGQAPPQIHSLSP